MDIDLADYDQVDEVKAILSNKQLASAFAGHLVETLSSSMGQTNTYDESVQCENDFVFLPTPSEQQQVDHQKHHSTATGVFGTTNNNNNNNTNINDSDDDKRSDSNQEKVKQAKSTINRLEDSSDHSFTLGTTTSRTKSQTIQAFSQHTNNTGTTNPFAIGKGIKSVSLVCPPSLDERQRFNREQLATTSTNLHTTHHILQQVQNQQQSQTQQNQRQQQQQAIPMLTRWTQPAVIECFGPVKPIGVIEIVSNVNEKDETKRVSNLMQQIVTKADSIRIDIPCAFCRERVPCLPSDISYWLDHMDIIHNCKCCSICNKLVGLGPKRDLRLMHEHVIEHFNSSWLQQRAVKSNFTFGLKQQWFSGVRCNIINGTGSASSGNPTRYEY